MNTPVQTYEGVASMLDTDFETIIPSETRSGYPVEGFEFTEGNYTDIGPRLGATYRLGEKTVLRSGFRHLLQPEPDELVHVPHQQPARGPGHDLHLGPGQPDAVVLEPDRPAGRLPRPDMISPTRKLPERPQDPVELRRAA